MELVFWYFYLYIEIYTIKCIIYTMNRYQIYFQPETVEFFDFLSSQTGLSRSRLMQETLDIVVSRMKVLLPTKKIKTSVLDMAGQLSIGNKKITKIATTHDREFMGR